MDADSLARRVSALLESDSRINLHRHPIDVRCDGAAVILEGDVENVAVKKLALERAGAADGVDSVVDRLRIAGPSRGDGAIRDWLCRSLLETRELATCTIAARVKGQIETLRNAGPDGAGAIEVGVKDGVIALAGQVISHSHRRIVGVLGWWTPGARDVINELEIVPAEDDNEAEIVEALRLVLEMDPLIEAQQIALRCDGRVVRLEGWVRTDAERQRAELDAWALYAIDGVVNRIEVQR